MTVEEAYKAGYDCGENGANDTNSHFKYFLTNALAKHWVQGKKDAKDKKEKQCNHSPKT